MGYAAFYDGAWDLTAILPSGSEDCARVESVLTAASEILYRATHGQMRFRRVSIAPFGVASATADIRFRNHGSGVAKVDGLCGRGQFVTVRSESRAVPKRQPKGCPDTAYSWPIDVAQTLVHEFGHYALGLHDEYAHQPVFCQCIMACDNVHAYCGPADHPHEARDRQGRPLRACWDLLAERFGLAIPDRARPDPDLPPPPETEFDSVVSTSSTVLATPADLEPELDSAIDAVAEAWTDIALRIDDQFKYLRRQGGNLVLTIGSAIPWVEAGATMHASRNLLVVGTPAVSAPVLGLRFSDLAARLARGKRVPVWAIAPTAPGPEIRDFAVQTGGECEALLRTDDLRNLELQMRLLSRLGRCVEGFGISYAHRSFLTEGNSASEIYVEAEAEAVVFIVCTRAGHAPMMTTSGPNGQTLQAKQTEDGSVSFIVATDREDGAIAGNWRLETKGSGNSADLDPAVVFGLVKNRRHFISTLPPKESYPAGDDGETTVDIELSLAGLPRAKGEQVQFPIAPTTAFRLELPPNADPMRWGDPNSSFIDKTTLRGADGETAHFETYLNVTHPVTTTQTGFVDFRVNWGYGPGPITRVLPFQLRIVNPVSV